MNILFGAIAVLSIAYYGLIISYAGIRASFSGFWLVLFAVSVILAVLFSIKRFRIFLKGLPLWVKVPMRTTAVLGMLCFLLVESQIVFHSFSRTEEDLDYLVVLGAQVRGETITKSLRYRLDTAIDYLEEHPDTQVIVTGGQGAGEAISEAAAMRSYLLEHEIEEKRIVMERHATNTQENMSFSLALMENKEASVGVVTNGFHVFRSVCIAREQGFVRVTGIAAPSDGILQVNLTVREFFAVLKDWFAGNI